MTTQSSCLPLSNSGATGFQPHDMLITLVFLRKSQGFVVFKVLTGDRKTGEPWASTQGWVL
jgi:hypothetical protein